MERRVRKSTARTEPFAPRRAGRSGRDLRAVVHHLSLGAGGRPRTFGGALRADRRNLSFMVSEIQLLSRGVGWLYRLVRHSSTNRGRDGHLFGRSGGAETR